MKFCAVCPQAVAPEHPTYSPAALVFPHFPKAEVVPSPSPAQSTKKKQQGQQSKRLFEPHA